MVSHQSDRKLIDTILSGTYTPFEFREFAELCYSLALPFIRKKIYRGKINCDIIGLHEKDIVYDCLADLFYRDEANQFPLIRAFFEHQLVQMPNPSDEECTIILRRLVLGKVNNNIIRLYSEADPALGKILRNLKLALERTQLFEQVSRFGGTYLIPRGVEAQLHLPPLDVDCLQQEFSRVALVHDNIPEMLRKLHCILTSERESQRAVPIVSAALMFKAVYVIGVEEEKASIIEQSMETFDMKTLAESVCKRMNAEMHSVYVETGKRTEAEFQCYMAALRTILSRGMDEDDSENETYYEHLRAAMPRLSKTAYAREHRTTLEYIARTAKERLKKELNQQ